MIKEPTIKEEVNELLQRYEYEINDSNTMRSIINNLSMYFEAKLPRDKFTFTDVTTDEIRHNNTYKIMVKTPWANARMSGEMELHSFLEFVTDLEYERALSLKYMSHIMELSMYVSEMLKHRGKTWDDLNTVFKRNDCETWIGGGASNLTMRDLTTIEYELDISLVRKFNDKELGIKPMK